MELVLLPVLLVVLLLVLLYKYGTRNYGTLEKLGIPVVKPYPFVGSVRYPARTSTDQEDMRNAKRFGKVWGVYEGPWPQVFVADAELAKRILIKDFDHFPDRPILFDIPYGRDMLDMKPGEQWKMLRSMLAPALASGVKLKAMMPTMVECAQQAFHRMEAKMRHTPVLSMREDLFGPLTLDIMAQFSFGIKVPNVADTSSTFVKYASAFSAQGDTPDTWMTTLMTSFPSIANYMMGRELVPAFKYFLNLVRSSIKQRRAEGVERPDLIGALMDAIDKKVPMPECRRLNITEELVMLQGAEMLMAAYDTIGTTLTITSYFLAKNPDVAARIAEEAAGVELTYEALQRLPVTEAAIQESLRLSPLISRHFRLCTRDWEYDGLRIPKGTTVILPLWPYHRDPEVFPEPERFLPNRWLGEQGRQLGQYSWMPFGLGPRACIGSRLGMMECKFLLAYLLQRYRLTATPETKLKYYTGATLFIGAHPIMCKVEKLQ
ncbi:cytochrome P450 3A29-like [Pollicipes pollicipes]|uniref:cytochrome P450 3A29-like n=2 Tax=Pollicipes pollicipes TaxID=41117 RepID=UPI001884D119|nr:cytochrome P450 3A29-like [Pollicipes pollicipes]